MRSTLTKALALAMALQAMKRLHELEALRPPSN